MRYSGLFAVLLSWSAAVAADESRFDEEQHFERSIRPVLVTVCFRCHGGERTAGGLRVDSREALLKGGESGPAIIEGDTEHSLLIKAIRRSDDVSAMPPDRALDQAVIDAFNVWVAAGAFWPKSGVEFRPSSTGLLRLCREVLCLIWRCLRRANRILPSALLGKFMSGNWQVCPPLSIS